MCVCVFCPDMLSRRYAFPLGLKVNRFYRLGAKWASAVGEVKRFLSSVCFEPENLCVMAHMMSVS